VVPDQIVDRTKGRPSTFFGGGVVAHVAFAEPFSRTLSKALVDAVRRVGVTVHEAGTYLCMEGPAFSTRAESRLHRGMDCDVIGMTAVPEARLAREAEMSYAMLAMITDYDCWKEDDHVSARKVVENLMANAGAAKQVVAELLPRLHDLPNDCADALKGAIFTDPSVIPTTAKKRLGPIISKYVR
jgi:5'-methylthioadenosine phosphorylase